MNQKSIISEQEALQILKNDLRRLAIEKHAPELRDANPERKAEIMQQIDREVENRLRRRGKKNTWGILLH